MSYALTIPLGAATDVALDFSTNASASKTTTDAANSAGVELPDCSDAAVTGVSYIDETFVKCCEEVKRMSGKSTKEKAEGIAQCSARGAATGACIALGPFTFGVTVALAPLCGSIGSLIAGRVMNWNTDQWLAAGAAGAACGAVSGGTLGPVCAFAAAELMGWLSDKLGPVFEGIFHPGAAKERELAARRAFQALDSAVRKFRNEADDAMIDLWSNSISSLKESYKQSVGLLSPEYQAKAAQILGFPATYDGIAKAFVAEGAASTQPYWRFSQSKTYIDALREYASKTGHGCEAKVKGCENDGYSEVCPFSFDAFFNAMYFATFGDELSIPRDQLVAFDKKMAQLMQSMVAGIFDGTQRAIIVIATKIAAVTAGLRQQELLAEAKAASETKIVSKAQSAAAAATAAARLASSWSSTARRVALTRVQQQYDIAKQARALLLSMPADAGTASANQKVLASIATAQAAVTKAHANETTAKLMIGGAVAAGVAGLGYLFLRRT